MQDAIVSPVQEECVQSTDEQEILEHFLADRGARYGAACCGALSTLLGLFALVGWLPADSALATLLSSMTVMVPAAGGCFMILGPCLIVMALSRPLPRPLLVCYAGLVALTALLVLLEQSAGLHWGVSLLFVERPLAPLVDPRPPIFAAVGLMILASACALYCWPAMRSLALLVALSASAFGAPFVLGYAYGSPLLYDSGHNPIALPAAIGLVLTGAGTATLAAAWQRAAHGVLQARRQEHQAAVFRLAQVLSVEREELQEQREEAKRRAEELETVINSIGDGVAICDLDGNIVRANPALAAMTGYTEEELALPPEERFQLLDVRYTNGQPVPMADTAPVQAAQQGKPCTTGPLVLLQGTERELYVLVSSVPLRDGLGHFRGLVTTSTNVTELQRAKQQVEREHALLKAVFETAPSALVVADAEGRITMTNRLAETLYPRPVPVDEPLETRAELQLCYPDGSPYQSQDLPLSRSVLKGETSENVHMLIAGPDGQTRHLLANSAPIRDESERITGAVAVFSDWTQLADAIREQERLLAELNEHRDHLENLVSQRTAELAASEAKYRELVENANSVILKWDKDGILTFANEYAHELFRYPPGELAGREATIVLPRRDSHGHDLRRIEDAVSTSPEEWAYNEHESLTSDGRLLWMAWANRPIYGRDGELEGMMCVGTDRTAQHEAEQKLLAYQEQLRHLAAELALAEQRERQRISIRLHDEVAQPLGALKIHLSMLQSEHPSAMAQIGKLVAMTDDAIKQARTVLTELSPPVLQNLGLIEAVRWWAGLVEERQGLPVRVEAPEEPLHIGQAHEITLFQAIKELLQNVVKHAKATGAWVEFEYLPEQMRVTVGDDGEGFDAGAIHPSVSGGFGLFSIQERLSYLGGDMAIASTAGRGCTITLTLPNQA